MKQVIDRPPNYDKIVKVFPSAANKGVMFCYGDTIFNPSGTHITEALEAHEEVHSKSQGTFVDSWWDRYLTDEAFRFDEELKAHGREYQVILSTMPRNLRRVQLKLISKRLASPLYGHITKTAKAKELIKQVAETMEF